MAIGLLHTREPDPTRKSGGMTGEAAETLRTHPAVLPGFVTMAVLLYFASSEGGYPATTWYPGALFLLILLGVALATLPAPARPSRPVVAALGLLTAYAAWTFVTIAWAGDPGDAWDGANRVALYVVIFALFALWPIRSSAAAAVLGVLGLGVALLGLLTLMRAGASADPETFFSQGRFSEPTGYKNADVALWSMAFLPCVLLAARREVTPLLRGAFLAGAGVLGGLALMGQSRASLLVVPVTLLVYLVLVPGRLRAFGALLAAALGVAAASGPLLDVFRAFDRDTPLGPALDSAVVAVLLVSVALAVVGTLWGVADRRIELSVATSAKLRRGGAVTAGAATLLAVVVALAVVGNPFSAAGDAWEEFKSGDRYGQGDDSGSRFTGDLGSNRYDLWRVALERFSEEPVAGIGIDNFQQDYLQRAETVEKPRYPHSLILGVLSQTGIVGTLLLVGALGAALAAGVAALRRGSGLGSGLRGAAGAGAVTVFVYFVLHGSLDWLWEFPALGGMAFAMLGVATALGRRAPSSPRPSTAGGRAFGAASVVVPGLMVGCLAASLLAPWLAEREMKVAGESWQAGPSQALDRLERAAALNPVASDPDLRAGLISVYVGDLRTAESRFRDALEREPRNAYAMLELGVIASERGFPQIAFEWLAKSAELTPRDAITADALDAVARLERLSVQDINDQILKRARLPAE